MKRMFLLCGALLLSAETARAASCGGDCNADAAVSVDEIVRGINIALGSQAVSECEAFDGNHDGEVTVDEIVTAVRLALDGCPAGQSQAFVVATNFSTGSFGTVTLSQPRSVLPASSQRSIHADAVARYHDGLVYIVNRFGGDSIQILDPANGFATVQRCLIEERSNPHDIAFVDGDKAYVTLYDQARIQIVDPTPAADCAGFLRGSIDLSAYADADELPEPDLMTVVGDRLYVSLQKLDRDNFFVPAGPGSVLVVDTASDAVLSEIVLASGNPFSQTNGLTVRDGGLWIAEVNQFGASDGGIERIDLATGASLGFAVTEATLGGDLTDFVLVSETLGYAVISLPDFSNQVVRFNPSTGALTGTLLGGGSYADIELNDRGELWVAQSTFGMDGVRIFDAVDGIELTSAVIDIELPPFALLFF